MALNLAMSYFSSSVGSDGTCCYSCVESSVELAKEDASLLSATPPPPLRSAADGLKAVVLLVAFGPLEASPACSADKLLILLDSP